MIFFYSGYGRPYAVPERMFKSECNLMFTFNDYKKTQKPCSRFRKVIKARKKAKARGPRSLEVIDGL